MSEQTNAQRLADEAVREYAAGALSVTTGRAMIDELNRVSGIVKELRRYIASIEQARDIAAEMAAQYAAERDQLRAKLEVAEASAKAAISKAEWQAITNTELNQLHAQLAALKDGQACRE